MPDEWYYAHDTNRIGPFSGQQLRDLANLGRILRTDTIWKEGVEKGALASKVKHLFSLPQVSVSGPVTKVSALSQLPASTPLVEKCLPVVESEPSPPKEVPPSGQFVSENTVAASNQPSVTPKPARKGRAVATQGADIVSQDGIKAKYRRKCTVCGHKDLALQTVIISNKMTNAKFYCPKCKKSRDVTIHCTLG